MMCRRLNGIGDEGAKTLLEAAGVSRTIQTLNLSTTEMKEQVPYSPNLLVCRSPAPDSTPSLTHYREWLQPFDAQKSKHNRLTKSYWAVLALDRLLMCCQAGLPVPADSCLTWYCNYYQRHSCCQKEVCDSVTSVQFRPILRQFCQHQTMRPIHPDQT